MGRPRKDPNAGMVVAREAVVVIVGARAPTYDQVEVIDRRTSMPVMINKDQPKDPGSEGIPYVFKQYQRVHRNHPAVKESPGSFMDIAELDDAELELVKS